MKGPFGLLLIGGGIILIVGLFTGKIQFPGGSATGATTAQGGTAGQAYVDKNGVVQPQGGTGIGGSTTAVQLPASKGGTKVCPPGYTLAPTGVCIRQGAIKNTSGAGPNTTQICFTIPFTTKQICLPNI